MAGPAAPAPPPAAASPSRPRVCRAHPDRLVPASPGPESAAKHGVEAQHGVAGFTMYCMRNWL